MSDTGDEAGETPADLAASSPATAGTDYTPSSPQEVTADANTPDPMSAAPYQTVTNDDDDVDDDDEFEDTQGCASEFAFESGEPEWKDRWLEIAEGPRVTIVMTLFTILALFMDDFRLWLFPKSSDVLFVVLNTVTFLIFAFELIVLSVVKQGYLGSFFFFLDMIAALSLVPDITFIWNPIVGIGTTQGSAAENLTITRAARASRAGSRLARLTRFVRLIRLVRIAKLSELFMRARSRNRVRPQDRRLIQRQSTRMVNKEDTPSKVGEHLSEKTTRRVVTMVLAMLFAVPALQVTKMDLAPDLGLLDLQNMAMNVSGVSQTQFDSAIASFREFGTSSDGYEWKVMFLRIRGSAYTFDYTAPDLDEYRTTELISIFLSEDFEALLSIRQQSQAGAFYNVLMTVFICFLLTVGALLFSKDANQLVIAPIERMVRIIAKLRENPLPNTTVLAPKDSGGTMETGVLENTLEKLTGLLQVGFGEAGTSIIQKNINDEGELNPMVDGNRMLAIFGFCHIRNFARISEVLGEDVMLFVNEIADNVHSEVHRLGGAANRNLGDAFLLVWRLPDFLHLEAMEDLLEQVASDPKDVQDMEGLTPRETMALQQTQTLANQALSAFIRVLCNCNAPSDRFQKFLNSTKLRESFPDFQVSMGCGLHVGWAIEGAIGSKYKIDASYLSPNVNTTARLMAATNQYHVPLMMSEQFWSILSSSARDRCRRLDKIAVKGSTEPLDIYTFDINYSMVKRADLSQRKPAGTISMLRRDIERRRLQPQLNMANSSLADFKRDSLLLSLQIGTPKDFRRLFERGVQAYLDGEWPEAEELISSAMRFKPDDGPSLALLSYIHSLAGQAPDSWAGYRALTSK